MASSLENKPRIELYAFRTIDGVYIANDKKESHDKLGQRIVVPVFLCELPRLISETTPSGGASGTDSRLMAIHKALSNKDYLFFL